MSALQERMAGDLDLGTFTPFQLFAGEAPFVTEHFTAAANFAAYEVFAVNAAGAAVKHDPVTDPDAIEAVAVGVTCFAVDFATQPDVSAYTGAFLNHEALVWHASLNTLEKRRAAFRGTTIKIGRLL